MLIDDPQAGGLNRPHSSLGYLTPEPAVAENVPLAVLVEREIVNNLLAAASVAGRLLMA